MFSVCDRNISNKSNVSIFLFGIFLGLIACLNVVGLSDGNVYAKSLSKTLVKTNSTSQRSAQSFAYDSASVRGVFTAGSDNDTMTADMLQLIDQESSMTGFLRKMEAPRGDGYGRNFPGA